MSLLRDMVWPTTENVNRKAVIAWWVSQRLRPDLGAEQIEIVRTRLRILNDLPDFPEEIPGHIAYGQYLVSPHKRYGQHPDN